MEAVEVNSLLSRVIRVPYLWAIHSFQRSFFALLVIIIIGIPAIQALQDLVRNAPYIETWSSIVLFASSLNALTYLLTFLFIVLIAWLTFLSFAFLSSKNIKDKFNKALNHWAIPLNSGWTLQNCADRLGMMLSVTNSDYPGTLKSAYGWYDYQITFLAKMDGRTPADRQNFSFVVRSIDNYNGVMLQVTKTHINPHLLYNSVYILDTEKNIQLPTVLSANDWIVVKVVVQGSVIDIYLNGFKVSYKIPSLIIKYGRSDFLSRGSVTLNEIQRVNTLVQQKYDQIGDILKMQSSPAKDEAMKTISGIFDEINKDSSGYNVSYSQILLEYQRGSVGFRESGSESAYFKDFRIRKL